MKTYKIIPIFLSVFFLVAVLITAIDFVVFQRGFYRYEYQKGNQAESIGMSNDDLMEATNALLDYTQNKREDIVVYAEVNGSQREVFDERETMHMVDVKNLYQNAIKARNILLIVSIVGFLIYTFITKEKLTSLLWDSFKGGLILLLMFVLAVGIWAFIDFDGFWMQFHYLFFDNDLFLLDPNVSIMINMFPSQFFFEMVLAIIICFIFMLVLIAFMIKGVERLNHA